MPKLLFFQPSAEADLRKRSRPPQGPPAPETASARSPRPLAVTPPPAPAPPARATPRGPPPKSASRANPAKNPGFRGTYVPSWRSLRPERRLHPREGDLKFGGKITVRPAGHGVAERRGAPRGQIRPFVAFTSKIDMPTFETMKTFEKRV